MGPMLVRRMEDRNLSCGFGGQGSIEELSRSYFGGGVGLRRDRRGLGREGPWGGGIRILFSFMKARETRT